MVELKHIRFEKKNCASNGNIQFWEDSHYGYLKLNMEGRRISNFKQLIIMQEYFGGGSEIKIYSDYGVVFALVTFWLKSINHSIEKDVITLSRNQESDVYKYGGVCPHCNAML